MKLEIPLADYMEDYAKKNNLELPKSVSLDTKDVVSFKINGYCHIATFKNGSVCIIHLVTGENRISFEEEEIFYYQIQYYPKEYGCSGVESDDPFYLIYKLDSHFEKVTDFLFEMPAP